MTESRCPACEAERQTREAVQNLDRFIAAIKPADRASDGEYEKRLSICGICGQNQAGTCMSCGCFVRIRAAQKSGTCPRKKWN